MENTLEVRPRYTDKPLEDEDPVVLEPLRPVEKPAPTPSSGLFNTMYENKVIVLLVIIAIICIGIVAYVVFRTPVTKNTSPRSSPQPPRFYVGDSDKCSEAIVAGPVQQPGPQPVQQPGPPSVQQPGPETTLFDKNKLSAILINVSREDNIADLADDGDYVALAESEDTEPKITVIDDDEDDSGSETTTNSPKTCSYILPKGQCCKRRVYSEANNGLCKIHQKHV